MGLTRAPGRVCTNPLQSTCTLYLHRPLQHPSPALIRSSKHPALQWPDTPCTDVPSMNQMSSSYCIYSRSTEHGTRNSLATCRLVWFARLCALPAGCFMSSVLCSDGTWSALRMFDVSRLLEILKCLLLLSKQCCIEGTGRQVEHPAMSDSRTW